MMMGPQTNQRNVISLPERQTLKVRPDEIAAHDECVVPAVKMLVDRGFTLSEVAEMLRVAADVLDEVERK
jgi:hypothetical protein